MVKKWVSLALVINFLLKDMLTVTPPKAVKIKSQLVVQEETVRLMEAMDFRTIAVEADAWKEFIGGSVGPS